MKEYNSLTLPDGPLNFFNPAVKYAWKVKFTAALARQMGTYPLVAKVHVSATVDNFPVEWYERGDVWTSERDYTYTLYRAAITGADLCVAADGSWVLSLQVQGGPSNKLVVSSGDIDHPFPHNSYRADMGLVDLLEELIVKVKLAAAVSQSRLESFFRAGVWA